MSKMTRYSIMLGLDDSGESSPIHFSEENLNGESVVIIIDEQNEIVWLWIGKQISFVRKRAASRIANSIKRFGYEIQNILVGKGIRTLETIEESLLGEPDIREKFEQLKGLFRSKFSSVNEFLVSFGEKTVTAKPVSLPAEEIIIQPAPQPPEPQPSAEVIASAKPKPSTPETLKITPQEMISQVSASTETSSAPHKNLRDILGSVKTGILITSVMKEYPELHVNHRSGEDSEEYELETPDGTICRFKVDGSKLVISPESTFGGEEKKIKIQKVFVEVAKNLPTD
ncbi:MAG: hypothetical protein ACFE7E_03910 [Candidatus Hodarchaeota archaeon]